MVSGSRTRYGEVGVALLLNVEPEGKKCEEEREQRKRWRKAG